MGLVAMVPLAFLFVTGLYLFAPPYATKWRSEDGRSEQRVDQSKPYFGLSDGLPLAEVAGYDQRS